MRVLVCGSSKFQDQSRLYQILDDLNAHERITLLINGGARGADYLSSQWAKDRDIPLKVFKADWNQYGEKAVFLLNDEMLRDAQPDLILAFPGGDVTADIVNNAKIAGIRVVIAALN